MRELNALVKSLVLVGGLAGCASLGPMGDGDHAPVPAGPLSIESATLAEDGGSVRIDFTGGKEFDPEDPCSVAYEGTAEIDGDELAVGVFAQRHPLTLPEGWACDAMGYGRTLHLDLPDPFLGTRVRDLAGYILLLEPPEHLAQIDGLPDGWDLRRQGNVAGSRTPRWERTWSPEVDPWPSAGSSMLSLYQAFGGPVETTGADRQPAVDINGQRATFYLHPPTGEMVVVWSIEDDELALVGYLADFTRAEFIALAESVTLPLD